MTEIVSRYGPVTEDVGLVGERLRNLARGHDAVLGETLAHVFQSGGKRIRPALVMLCGKLGDYQVDRLVTLAAAFEVVHTATLVHDDTVDQALTRRGLETVSAVWNGTVAILVGDFLFAQSAALAAELDNVRIIQVLSDTVMAMSSGELQQYSSTRGRVIDEADYFQRITGKTASLFGACCEGAGVISDQSEERIEALRSYGINLGIAFQIVDDVLDYQGSNEQLGKPAGNDLLQGTITLPAILYAQSLPGDSDRLEALRQGRDIESLVRSIRGSRAPALALRRAHEYAGAACRNLDVFPPSEARDALIRLAAQVTERQF